MTSYKLPNDLKYWKDNIENLLVVRQTIDGTMAYLIVDAILKQPFIIEDDAEAKSLAEDMIRAGVNVVSVEEAQQIMFPKPVPNR
jgi:hypothetical protein